MVKYKFSIDDFESIETAKIKKIEGNKIYCVDVITNEKLIFNSENGRCYTSNPTFGAKKTLIF